MAIHPTAIISRDAIIHESTEIGPYVIIEDEVKIGKNNKIMAGAFIGHSTNIGDNNEIHMGAIIGHVPQDKKYRGEKTCVVIGNNNIIREYVTIHRGSSQNGSTIVGNNCLLMGSCHIAHDCNVGDEIIMANMAAMAGHVHVGDRAFISGGAMIHQFVTIGRLAILAGNSRFSMDIPPFVIAAERNQVWGVNVVGLRRAGFTSKTINELKEFYRVFFKEATSRDQILEKMKQQFAIPEVTEFVEFIKNSKRGICRANFDSTIGNKCC